MQNEDNGDVCLLIELLLELNEFKHIKYLKWDLAHSKYLIEWQLV